MTTVLVAGWNVGFQKVKFTFLLQARLGYSLSRAKHVTDAVLANNDVELQVEEEQGEALVSSMKDLGARCAVAEAHR